MRGILRHLITKTLRLSPKWKLQGVARLTGLAAALAAILCMPAGFAAILIWAGWPRTREEEGGSAQRLSMLRAARHAALEFEVVEIL